MALEDAAPDLQLLSIISKWREQDEFTDVELYHDAGSFKVHRIIICPQSKVFYKACTEGFQEEFTGVIHMEHIPHLELKYMVNFLYNFDYAETESCQPETHVRMFALADQYDIPKLGTLAAQKYCDWCANSWSPQEFLICIREIYETTPDSVRTLRDTACTVIRRHMRKILQGKDVSIMYEKTLDETSRICKGSFEAIYSESIVRSLSLLWSRPANGGPSTKMQVMQNNC